MTRTLHHAVFALMLLSACDKRSNGVHAGSSSGDGGSAQDGGSPISPNMFEDAALDAAIVIADAGADPAAQGGSAGRSGAASSASDGSGGTAGATRSPDAGSAAPMIQDAGSEPDTDSGPSEPKGLCTSCGACEEVQKVVSTMHTTNPVTYKDPPPTSGPHNPCWARWGIHDEPLAAERWVHNLEHGGVVFLYNCPDGCDAEVAILKDISSKRSRTILTSYPNLPARFGVVSWGRRLVSSCFDQQALLEFYAKNFDHAPESNSNPPNPNCPP